MFLLAMLMYCPKILYTYSRYIFGSFVSTHLQMNLKRKLKAKLLFKSSCFKRCMVCANNKVLVFPLLYDSLIHVRKKGFFLCAMWPFSTQVWQGFSCDWYMIAKKKICVHRLTEHKDSECYFLWENWFLFCFQNTNWKSQIANVPV